MTLWQIIKEDFLLPKVNDPALHSNCELIFNYPGVWAIVNYRFSNSLYKNNFKRLARFISGISQFLTNIDIHPCATIGRRVDFLATPVFVVPIFWLLLLPLRI